MTLTQTDRPAATEAPIPSASCAAMPKAVMILAAGEGTRMRPLTETRPKPLLEVAGRSLLDRILDRVVEAGISQVVVNSHYLGQQVIDHMQENWSDAGFTLSLSQEDALLETAGGTLNALPLMGDADPIMVINSDALWMDGPVPTLRAMADGFDPDHMDALLMMYPMARLQAMHALGDFLMEPDGVLTKRPEGTVAPYIYAGVQIISRRVFDGVEPGRRSFLELWATAQEAGRLYGQKHDGWWYHVGTPQALEEATDLLQEDEARWLRP
ncbi:MAG: nucleotidyltransferase family protein [Alphaproteobacteria bacterium]